MQQSRFELKYLVNEDTALRIRDFLQTYIGMGYIDLDEYSANKPNYSYAVHSVYLDSDDLKTYWDTINGNKNRFKLRFRYYDDKDESPVFFEIKRRMNHCILKQRGGVRKEVVPWYLAGHGVDPNHLLAKKSAKQHEALQRFCYLMHSIGAKPRVHIAYMREAYVSSDDKYRVTLDRGVHAEPNTEGLVKIAMKDPVYSFVNQVILELKFTDRFPSWFGELVRRFNVMQCGAAKYLESVQGIGHIPLKAFTPVVAEAVHRMKTIPSWVNEVDPAEVRS